MRLILIGCEYAGTTTLANAINQWAKNTMGAGFCLIHEHFKLPDTKPHGPELTDEEIAQFQALTPRMTEVIQRHNLYYHTPAEDVSGADFLGIGIHIDEAIYGPLYYDYGGSDDISDRSIISKKLEHRVMKFAPATALVLVKASTEVNTSRMKQGPHKYPLVPEKDIPHVLQKFEEAHQTSILANKLILDTSSATVNETVSEFAEQIQLYLTASDRMRLLLNR